MDLPLVEEINVICVNCNFPTVTEYDANGALVGFKEEPGPKDEEEALAQGWLDHGLGLFCPKCSLTHLEDLAREEAQGVQSGVANDIGEIFDAQFLRSMHPDVEEEVIGMFVAALRHGRLVKLRAKMGLPTLSDFPEPKPRDEAQAQQILAVAETVKKAISK